MQTIEIVPEPQADDAIAYRAICGERESVGATPGEALDAIERQLADRGIEQSSVTVVVVQRFRPNACN